MSEELRLRIAPSPTGSVHLGLARTALFNWAYARGRGGRFVLRIEDTDRARSTQESERAILEGLAWLGIDWDEGPDVGGPYAPYRQSERLGRHRELAERLLRAGAAYRCFCTSERLEAVRAGQTADKATPRYDGLCRDLDPAEAEGRAAAGEPAVLRFRVPPGETAFSDEVRGELRFDNAEVDDWVMLRADGAPTYNFVVVCDDLDMRISHVFRGEEHLVNTPKQVLLYAALGERPPRFAHLPLLLGTDRKKLSKRSGDTSLEDYRRKGYPREAVVNFLCLQGWALDGATEVFSVEQLVERFDIRDVSKGGSIFDSDKFLWLAGEYLRGDSDERVAERALPFLVDAGLAPREELEARRDWLARLVAGEKERVHLYSELPARLAHYFAADERVVYEPAAEQNARKGAGRLELLAAYLDWLRGRDDLEEPQSLGAATKAWIAERGVKLPELFQPLRCALTGMAGGRDLFEIVALLGRERALRRIEAALARLA